MNLAKISGLDWLQMANFCHFAGFSIFSFRTWGSDWLELANLNLSHNFSHLLPPKHLILENLKILCFCRGVGVHWHIIWILKTFLNHFSAEAAQNDWQWQILPKKWLRLGSKWPILVILQVFPSFPPKSGSDWPGMANFTWFTTFPIFYHQSVSFWRNLKNFHSWGGIHQQMFWVFQLFKIISHQIDSKWPTMANFATKVAWMSSKWAILVKFQQALKYLSGILTDLHRIFRTGLVFLS